MTEVTAGGADRMPAADWFSVVTAVKKGGVWPRPWPNCAGELAGNKLIYRTCDRRAPTSRSRWSTGTRPR